MKRYASLTSLVIAGTLFLSLAGCNKSDKSTGNASTPTASSSSAKTSSPFRGFIGTWKPVALQGLESITINDDGTYVTIPPDGMSGKWTVTGTHVTLVSIRGDKVVAGQADGVLESDGRLSLSNHEKTVYFVKE